MTPTETEIAKLMQFARECAQGSQTVSDFKEFEKTAQKLSASLSGMDRHIFDGHFKKCKETHESQNPGLGRKVFNAAQTVAPYVPSVVKAAKELDPVQAAGVADKVLRFVGIDIFKGIQF